METNHDFHVDLTDLQGKKWTFIVEQQISPNYKLYLEAPGEDIWFGYFTCEELCNIIQVFQNNETNYKSLFGRGLFDAMPAFHMQESCNQYHTTNPRIISFSWQNQAKLGEELKEIPILATLGIIY